MALIKSARTLSLLVVGLGLAVNASAQSFLTNGLVAYYPFNGSATDASGNGHDGTIYGAVLTTNRFGEANRAYRFGGTSAYITAPLSSTVFSNDFTASLWFNASDYADAWPMLLEEEGNTALRMGLVGLTSGAGSDSFGRLYAHATRSSPVKSWEVWRMSPTPLNTFCQVVITKAGTNAAMYFNAQLTAMGKVFDPNTPVGNTLYIGRAQTEDVIGGYVFHGVIDDIRIYNRALSSNEVAQLYAIETTPPLGFETNGLVAYYPFSGSAADASGNGNNGTVNGANLTADRFDLPASAYDFNGTSSYIAIPQNSVLNSLSNLTLSAWVWQRVMTDTSTLLNKALNGIPDGWMFDTVVNCTPNVRQLRLQGAANNSCNATGVTEYSLMKWHHVVATVSGTVGTVYLDGHLDGLGNVGSIPLNTLDVFIGSAHPSPRSDFLALFNGKIDDVRIYNRALSSKEVAELYNIESGPKVNLIKAVKPSFSYLTLGTNYQMQISTDMTNWVNEGLPFTATNRNMVYPQYFDVENWGGLFFRLR